jgi:hypothetical protein
MMRTEDDLRAAFRALERHTPDADEVLRAVYRQVGEPGQARRRTRFRHGWHPFHARLIVSAAAAVAIVAIVTAITVTKVTAHGPATSRGPIAGAPLRARLLTAIDAARSDILSAQSRLSGPGEAGPGSGTGSEQTLTSPSYPRTGQQVSVRTIGRGSDGKLGKDSEYIFTMPESPGAASTSPIDAGVWGGADLNTTGTFITVYPATHTWGEWHHLTLTLELPADAAGIRHAISHDQLKVIRHAKLHGQQAIELGITTPSNGGAALRVTTARLWINATTDLPMRQTLQFSDGKRSVTDYTFLPPTAANLAKLHPAIPAGYQRTTQLPSQRPKK